jgi:hypothetical protein
MTLDFTTLTYFRAGLRRRLHGLRPTTLPIRPSLYTAQPDFMRALDYEQSSTDATDCPVFGARDSRIGFQFCLAGSPQNKASLLAGHSSQLQYRVLVHAMLSSSRSRRLRRRNPRWEIRCGHRAAEDRHSADSVSTSSYDHIRTIGFKHHCDPGSDFPYIASGPTSGGTGAILLLAR